MYFSKCIFVLTFCFQTLSRRAVQTQVRFEILSQTKLAFQIDMTKMWNVIVRKPLLTSCSAAFKARGSEVLLVRNSYCMGVWQSSALINICLSL